MFNTRFKKIYIYTSLAVFVLLGSSNNASSAELTQRDWMITLTDTAGWLYGLPDEPQDPDYINIMIGNREFRFEAEEHYDKDRDNVSVLSFSNFGDFSGSGWLNGSRTAVDTHLTFTLPLSGRYEIRANVRRPGHVFHIGETTVAVEAGERFTEVAVGTFTFDAGPQEVTVTIPPGGSIDFISLAAPHHAMIAPPDGWDPDASLTWEVINTTLLQLFKLADIFPLSEDSLVLEAEDFPHENVKIVELSYLGGKWLQAGGRGAEIQIPLQGLQGGFYSMNLHVQGKDITIVIGGHHTIKLEGKAYLDEYTFPALFLTGQESNITVTLPPDGGIDKLVLTKHQIDPADVKTLFNLEQERPPTAQDLDTIATILAYFGVER